MCSINWTKSRGHILFCKILSKRSPWALKDEEPCLFYCKDTPNSLGGMRLFECISGSRKFNFPGDQFSRCHLLKKGNSLKLSKQRDLFNLKPPTLSLRNLFTTTRLGKCSSIKFLLYAKAFTSNC